MINRRNFLKTSGLAAAAAFFTPGVSASFRGGPDPDGLMRNGIAVPAHRALFTPIRRGMGTFEGRGGTIGWYIADDSLVLVDTQFPKTAAECWDGIQKKSSRKIDFLINSHHHGDHTAGNPTLGPHTDHIVAHENVPVLQKAAAERNDNLPDQVYAETLFKSEWSQDLGSETVRMKYYGPAHTGGDATTHFENADVVHVGDLVFNRVPPYIDLPGGSDTSNWISVLENVYDDFTDDTVLIYGHGNPSYGITGTRDDLLATRDFLTALREYVQKGITSGKSVDELLVDGLPGFDEYVNPERPKTLHGRIQSVYEELSGPSND